MGNKFSRKRQVVDERFTRPQGLYQHKEVDHKKLKKLILDSKLAPCYPGLEENSFDLEECPICFLFYPSLNRSRCCAKGICTECFLQMKPPHSTRPTQCPFCKTCNYGVEYRGMRSKEEKGIEQVEDQRVIEAIIRMQQQEIHNDEDRTQRRLETCSSSTIMTPDEVGYRDLSSTSYAVPSHKFPVESEETESSQDSQDASISRQPSRLRWNRDDQFDVDLEDLMVMEAIWLSIQENDTRRLLAHGDAVLSEHATDDHYISSSIATTSQTPSPSGGLACAIAALAERQHTGRGPASDLGNTSNLDMLPESLGPHHVEEREGYASESWANVSSDSRRDSLREEGEWGTDNVSEVAEAGTSYASSETAVEVRGATVQLPHGVGDQFQTNVSGPILPESRHHLPFRSGRKNPPLLISLSLSFFNLGFNSPSTTMSSATTSLFKPLPMADGCITSIPTISTLKTSYPFSSLPSKPIKPLQLSYSSSPSPSWVSLKNKLSSSNLITLVASTSDWAQQEEENPTEETVTEPETQTEASVSDYEGEVATEEVEESAADETLDADYEQDPPEEAKLFVGNLPYDVTSEQLAQLFDQAGEVQVSEVIYNRETDRSRGFGFVWFKTVDEAEKAIEMFNRYDLNGRYLTVNTAAPRGSRPERTPRAFEPSFRIYVGNLPWQVDDVRLEQVFSEYGKVVEARVVYDRESGRSRGFAFVTMSSQSELDDAINAMDGQNLDGRTLTVNVAQERPRRSSF